MKLERDGATLYLGDAAEVLEDLVGPVDAVIADPPYGIGFDRATWSDDPEGYGAWLWPLLEKAEGLCNPGSPVFVFQAGPNIRHFHEWFPRPWRVFAAAKNFVQMRPVPMNHSWDPVVAWWTEGERFRPDSPPVNRDWFVANSASFVPKGRGELDKGHPTPKQLDLMSYLVRFCRPGGLVLDPFMGSGTTALACHRLGRRFVGVELNPDHFDLARRRLEDFSRQLDLFA